MSSSQTWTTTTTGPTTTTTTTNGSNQRTIVSHSGPDQHSTTSTTTVRSTPMNTSISVGTTSGKATSSQATQRTNNQPRSRGVPAEPPLHEYNSHHGLGETAVQHAEHSKFHNVTHWGLSEKPEKILFYSLAIPSWACEIAAAVLGSYYSSHHPAFIATFTVYLVLNWSAWFQTVVQMMQRASWVRDESNLDDRRRFLYLAVRLNRLMLPTAAIALPTFIVAYARRFDTNDLANWLLFLLFFIFGTVFSVMNAYNNISWESDRLDYEEGSSPYGNVLLAALGIPSKPLPDWRDMTE